VDIKPIHRCSVGIDVHLNKLVVCILRELDNGEIDIQIREFGGFKRDRREMSEWIASFQPEVVIMESTGIYWKSPYAALEKAGIKATLVNARHVAKVEGRKTDICDAQWLAMLGRCGLLRGSFIPPEELRHLRQLTRYHDRLTKTLIAEKNRLLKVLADAGIRLSALVSDPHGVACRNMIDVLLNGGKPEQAIRFVGRLKADKDEILASLDGELTQHHLFLARKIQNHIDDIEKSLAECEIYVFNELSDYQSLFDLLLTIPGMDRLAIAKLIVEIGVDMSCFGNTGRLAAWTGLCPGNHESAGKRKNAKTAPANPYVRRLLIEVAHAAVKTQCYFREFHQSLVMRRGRKKAIVATAHKIIKVVYILLTRQTTYKDKTIDFEQFRTKRNAPRWIKALRKHGMLPAVP